VITVRNLTKRYGDVVAVDDISFNVERGEVVGFLGPNGAGKSTTMRVLTGFLPATAGTATVAGCDVGKQSLEVRRHIGYLPENVPLYTEMRVREYLNFRGKLKGMSRGDRRKRAGEVMELCGIAPVARTTISNLSKGYRQRVGLADALLADPEILILDEPTIGLDPNQIRQVRRLIKDLAEGHTVILSTHILPEVEMTCGRIIIIDRGRIAAMGPTRALIDGENQPGSIVALVQGPGEVVKRTFAALEGVTRVTWNHQDEVEEFQLETRPDVDLRGAVFSAVVEGGWKLLELRQRTRTLEDIFVEITAGG